MPFQLKTFSIIGVMNTVSWQAPVLVNAAMPSTMKIKRNAHVHVWYPTLPYSCEVLGPTSGSSNPYFLRGKSSTDMSTGHPTEALFPGEC